MLNKFYGFLADQKLRQLNLFNYLDIAEKYGKVYRAADVFNPDGKLNRVDNEKPEPIFVSDKSGENESYVVFYDNIFVLFSINKELNDSIIQIYVKRPEDEWTVPVSNDGTEFDVLNPNNVKVEVYVKYDVSVLKLNRRLSRCMGEEYRSGKWNKIFYRSIISFLDRVNGYTELNQIEMAYAK